MLRGKKRSQPVVAGVLVLALLAGVPVYAYSAVPVAGVIQAVEQVIHYVLFAKQLVQMMKDGDLWGMLGLLLNVSEEYFNAEDLGTWAEDIGEARSLYDGVSTTYSQGKEVFNELFGGEVDEFTAGYNTVEFLDATALRAVKEIGKFREFKAARDEKNQTLMSKAEAISGRDQGLQVVASVETNVLQAEQEQTMKIVTTNELLSTMLEEDRRDMALDGRRSKALEEGIGEFLDEADLSMDDFGDIGAS